MVCQKPLMPVWLWEWYSYLRWMDILIRCIFVISDTEEYIMYNFFWLNDRIIPLRIMWTATFNACVEPWKYCIQIFTCIGHNNLNVFTTMMYIDIYLYNISLEYQSCILPYYTCVSFPRNCGYVSIQAHPLHVYHVVHFTHYWKDVHTVT